MKKSLAINARYGLVSLNSNKHRLKQDKVLS